MFHAKNLSLSLMIVLAVEQFTKKKKQELCKFTDVKLTVGTLNEWVVNSFKNLQSSMLSLFPVPSDFAIVRFKNEKSQMINFIVASVFNYFLSIKAKSSCGVESHLHLTLNCQQIFLHMFTIQSHWKPNFYRKVQSAKSFVSIRAHLWPK